MNDSGGAGIDPIAAALAEDVGPGDVTSLYFIDEKDRSRAKIIAREPAIVAGAETAAAVFNRVDESLRITLLARSGAAIEAGCAVVSVSGCTRSILAAERVALNFLQRLSGVATLTRRYVDAVAGTGAVILDTRKTTPGLRALEKAAVRAGGGRNHRLGLFDMALIKDNHLQGSRDLAQLRDSIARLRQERPEVPIEIEADTIEQVREFLALGADRILLDNMNSDQIAEAVRLGNGSIKFEASGGITLENVRQLAETGVDFISVGALTHSARAVDFSLELTQ